MKLGEIYHIYNRANGKENLFANEGNYIFFLERMKKHLLPIVDIYAWCLMPNHFHFLLKIKEESLINQLLENSNITKSLNLEKYISQQFSNMFNSYTQAFNKQQDRHGSLFSPNFKRVLVADEIQFRNTLCYIHYNPIHHRFVKNLNDWKFTSFHSYISTKATQLDRETVLKIFESKEAFLKCHALKPDINQFLEME